MTWCAAPDRALVAMAWVVMASGCASGLPANHSNEATVREPVTAAAVSGAASGATRSTSTIAVASAASAPAPAASAPAPAPAPAASAPAPAASASTASNGQLTADGKGAASSAASAPSPALYELEVEAPPELRTLLLAYLDLARFQNAPQSAGLAGNEIDRLAAGAPAQARSLLETEGYFDADVKVAESRNANGLPHIVITAVPGPRVVVESVKIDSTHPLAARDATREEPWTDRLAHLRERWALPVGEPFRDPAWRSAKTATIGQLRADGYASAAWQSTHAKVDATANTAALDLLIEPGPLFLLGPLRIEGLQRYDESAVINMRTFRTGQPYSERLLLDYQDRLVKIGLFGGASVELDASGPPEAAPVVVKVTELPEQQATFGVGFSANTGPRVSVEHYDRKLFGYPWISHSNFTFGPNLKSLGTELTSYPHGDQWRDLAAANVEQLRAADENRNSVTARVGRSQDTTRFERLYYLEATHARVESAPLATSSDAISANYNWLRRDVDNVLQPTVGNALSLQGGAGYGRGNETRSDIPGAVFTSKGPFARAYTRFTVFRTLGDWFANARLEAGQVFVHDRIGIPDTILFRAGGDSSVRGYGYRTLAPTVNTAVVGGRVLATGSIEFEHPILAKLPALLGAVFVDAGNAADKWNELHPVVGFGVGAHYRSPVGPIRVDIAYGQHEHRLRLHLSVGVTF